MFSCQMHHVAFDKLESHRVGFFGWVGFGLTSWSTIFQSVGMEPPLPEYLPVLWGALGSVG